MPAYSSFALLSDSLKNQTSAIEALSRNIANIATTGYKRTDVRFSEVLNRSSSFENVITSRGFAGAEAIARSTNGVDGSLVQTGAPLDVALSGSAFFLTRTERDNLIDNDSSEENFQLTDAGSFARKLVKNSNGDEIIALQDLGGNYVMGYRYNNDTRAFDTPTSLNDYVPIQIESNKIQRAAQSTKNVQLRYSLDPTKQVGDVNGQFKFNFNIFDGAISNLGVENLVAADYKRTVNATATKIADHQWSVQYQVDGGTITSPDQVITFNASGAIQAPKTHQLAITWDANPTKPDLVLNQSVLLDNNDVSEFISNDDSAYYNSDGFQDSSLRTVYINKRGELIANYDSGQEIPFAKLAIVGVQNPEGLRQVTNTHFGFTNETGQYKLIDPATSTTISLKPSHIEDSNVDLTTQFTDLLTQQRSYQSVSSALNTINELYQLAINLYR